MDLKYKVNKDIKYKMIKDYENYNIDEYGIVYNNKTKKIIQHNNRLTLTLYKKNTKKSFTVTRLIYTTWYDVILTPKDIIKFKDNDNNNLHYTNLININDINKHDNHMILDTTKEWKIFRDFDNYKISDHGDIFSIKSNKLFNPYTNLAGYKVVILMKDNERYDFLLHRVVYITFKGDIPDEKVIDHINRIKNDNRLINLQEASYSENSLNCTPFIAKQNIIYQYTLDNKFIKEWSCIDEIYKTLNIKNNISSCCLGNIKTAHGFIWKYPAKLEDISDFVTVNTHDEHTYNYKINKNGDVINKLNILLQTTITGGYKTLKLKSEIDGKFKRFRIHRLVALTFIPNDVKENIKVNHLDENKLNNHVDNLEWCTQKANSIHSCGRKVNQYTLTGEFVQSFNAISEANRFFNKKRDTNTIRFACHGKQNTAYGFKWTFAE